MTPPAAMPPAASPRLKLRLAPAAEAAVRSGHPWVFDRAIRDQNRQGTAGELAVIYDRRDRFLALGFYDPDSPIRVRILHVGDPLTIDDAWWRQRLALALDRRRELFALSSTSADGTAGQTPADVPHDPARHTDGFRLINGESDGWPALVLDRYARTLVIKLYSAVWFPRLAHLVPIFRHAMPWADTLVLRLSRNVVDLAQQKYGRSEGFLTSMSDNPGEVVVFHENGLRFEAAVCRGQKTGFFLDQRENRARLESLAAGREALNAFSFSGGFSLYAARGGARSVTDLDLSDHALESARRNFALNRNRFPAVTACRHHTVQGDAFDWLARPSPARFDLIVVDPPSLARRESEHGRALAAYANLHANALAHLRPHGILVAASCSAHVDEATFFATVRRTARHTGRPFRELWTSTHAADHPATFPEARYLKCIAIELD
ncbi:MAG: class I SAM-dependent methyltransferase [Verrucomicrobiales bacterium]